MNFTTIYPFDLVNGEGVRTSIFFSGCHHGCRGCFNQKAWNPGYGEPFTKEIENGIIESLKSTRRIIDGVSLLGGDPLYPGNVSGVLAFAKRVKTETDKTVWMWTGYRLEEIQSDPTLAPVLEYVDVLIDGKFEEENTDPELKFRGSTNQRILIKGQDF